MVFNYYLIKFADTDLCMSAFNSLKEKGFNVKMVPTPNCLGDGCGLSIRVDDISVKSIIDSFKESLGINHYDLYESVSSADSSVHDYLKVD